MSVKIPKKLGNPNFKKGVQPEHLKGKETQYKHSSSYLTVPPEWLGRTFINDAEHLKNVNPDAGGISL